MIDENAPEGGNGQHGGNGAGDERGEKVRSSVANRLEQFADALDQAGDQAEAQGGAVGRTAGPAHEFADRLEEIAGYVRSQDFDAMREDIEREVRANPLRSTLVALGIGFMFAKLGR